MRILNLALKDLSQIFRDKRSLLFLVAMPIAFTFFMGLAFSGGNKNSDNRIPLALIDPQPGARLNKIFFDRLNSSDTMKVVPMNESSALDALHKGDVAGVLEIPAGFSDQAEAGNEAQLTLITDTTSAQGQSLYQLLRVPVSQLMSAVEISRESTNIIAAQKNIDPSNEQNMALDLVWSKWNANSQISLVRVEEAVAKNNDNPFGDNPYNQSSPGILVQFAIFGLTTSAQILVQEKKSRTLQRLMTTAMKPWEIIAGHMLAMFGIVFLQTAMLVIFGQLVLNVNYLREPLGTLLVAVALCLWIASMGLLIGVIAKEEQQVILFSMIAMFVFSALGGAWFPLEVAGSTFSTIGKLTPSAWAMDGFQNILIRGLGLESTWLPIGILMAYSILFFVIAVWRFRKTEM